MHGTFGVSHQIEPAILYFGTPVVLICSTNEDGSYNLAPMPSAARSTFWRAPPARTRCRRARRCAATGMNATSSACLA